MTLDYNKDSKSEIERIKKAYQRRYYEVDRKIYSLFDITSLFYWQNREKKILELLNKYVESSLTNKKILDVGCGKGNVLRDFIKYGANPANLCGVDLLDFNIKEAKKLSDNIKFYNCNAEQLPFDNNTFDIILSFTVFSSILDKVMKDNVAAEMIRVLKKNGIIIWYDFRVNNPRNPDVRGIKRRDVQRLFPQSIINLERITLAPPISRRLAPVSVILCNMLEKIPLLCSHYIGTIKKCSENV